MVSDLTAAPFDSFVFFCFQLKLNNIDVSLWRQIFFFRVLFFHYFLVHEDAKTRKRTNENNENEETQRNSKTSMLNLFFVSNPATMSIWQM